MDQRVITVVGAGLAGTECALQLANLGYEVRLIEMRGVRGTPAHVTDKPAELVCSNSMGSTLKTSATGQLKAEARSLGSFVLRAAETAQVPAGNALAVDRSVFQDLLEKELKNQPRIQVERRHVASLDEIKRPAVIATGPLTSDELSQSLIEHFGEPFLFFFDAIAPIVDRDSLNLDRIHRQDRYGEIGSGDYLNCVFTKEEYLQFAEAVNSAEKIEFKEFEKKTPYFEGCMPIEELFRRGIDTPRFGPMKPAGITDPRTGRWPFACVQLRAENADQTAFNLVGFQTKLTYSEQKRVFRMIPGLEDADFLKLGGIHRNLFVQTPSVLDRDLSSKKDPLLFFAGQITGVEGYFDSACVGLLVAKFLNDKLNGRSTQFPQRASAMGSLLHAITNPDRLGHFQPTNINYSLFPPPPPDLSFKTKTDKRAWLLSQANEAGVF